MLLSIVITIIKIHCTLSVIFLLNIVQSAPHRYIIRWLLGFQGENNDLDEGQPIASILPENGIGISDPIESDGEDEQLQGIVKTLINDLGKQVDDEEDELIEEKEEEAKKEENSEQHRCEVIEMEEIFKMFSDTVKFENSDYFRVFYILDCYYVIMLRGIRGTVVAG